MDTRKVTLIATVAAILLLAVGIGYAYTAITENSGNNATSEYLVVTPSDGADPAYSDSFDKEIAYDTVKISGKVKYSITTSEQVTLDGNKVAEIGTIYIIVDQTKTKATTYDFNFMATSGTIDTTHFVYKVSTKTGSGANAGAAQTAAAAASATINSYVAATGMTISGATVTASTPYTCYILTLYAGLSTDGSTIVDEVQVADASLPLPVELLNNVTFTFKATAANPTNS